MSNKKSSNSFDPIFRLHYRREYVAFFGKSKAFRLSQCVVFRVPNEFGHYRLGITIKARGSSVDRNKIKRQIREVFRVNRLKLGSYDYNVVIPSGKKLVHPFPKELRKVLEKEFIDAIVV